MLSSRGGPAPLGASHSRSAYQRAVGYLQNIRPFPDGSATAQAIADEWKATYRLRRVLLDELRKAGF